MTQALKRVNRNAVVSWCPSAEYGNLLATATAAGSLDADFDSSAHLEVFAVDTHTTEKSLVKKGRAELQERAYTIAWGATGTVSPLGLIAAGLDGGSIGVYDPAQLLADSGVAPLGSELLLSNPTDHKSAVSALDFNPKRPILASGAENSEVFIWDLQHYSKPSPYAPGPSPTQTGNVTSLKWNTQSEFILATAYQDGRVLIWDLRKKRPIVTVPGNSFRDRITSCRSIAWSPTNALELVIASDDDAKPVVQVWNLKKPHIPERTLTGHTKGISSTSWCPDDANYLVTTAKDNRTIVWNMKDGTIASELEGTNAEHNFDVQWAPRMSSMLSTASYDGQLRVYGLHDPAAGQVAGNLSPPSWMAGPAPASFAFGGKLVKVSGKSVSISSIQTQPELVAQSEQLSEELDSMDSAAYCETRAANATSNDLKDAWKYIGAMCSGDTRNTILRHIGFTNEEVVAAAEALRTKPAAAEPEPEATEVEEGEEAPTAPAADDVTNLFGEGAPASSSFDDIGGADGDADPFAAVGGDDPFDNFGESNGFSGADEGVEGDAGADGEVSDSIVDLAKRVEKPLEYLSGSELDNVLAKAILTGNHEIAVGLCLSNNRMADALMLAVSSDDSALWEKTREKYFASLPRSHYINAVSSIVRGELKQLIAKSSTDEWKCTLAILCTYAKPEDFGSLCSALGDLLQHVGKPGPALLSYICAQDLDRSVSLWSTVASAEGSGFNALISLVEMATVFQKAVNRSSPSPGLAEKFCEFAELLAGQGALKVAARFLQFAEAPQFEGTHAGDLLKRLTAEDAPVPAAAQAQPQPQVQPQAATQQQATVPAPQPAHQQQYNQQFGQPAQQQYSQPAQPSFQAQPFAPTSQPFAAAPAQPFTPAPAQQQQPQQTYGSSQPFAAQPFAAQPAQPYGAQPFAAQPVQPQKPAGFSTQSVMYSGFSGPKSVQTPVSPVMPVQAPTIGTFPVSAAAAAEPVPEALPEEIFKDPEGKEVVDRLEAFIAGVKSQKAGDARAVKTLDDAAKRVATLHALLRKGSLSSKGLEVFTEYVTAAENRDGAALAAALNSLTTNHYEELSAKVMLGLKKLKNVC